MTRVDRVVDDDLGQLQSGVEHRQRQNRAEQEPTLRTPRLAKKIAEYAGDECVASEIRRCRSAPLGRAAMVSAQEAQAPCHYNGEIGKASCRERECQHG